MQHKTLTTANGSVMQITVTPWEFFVLKIALSKSSIPEITKNINTIRGNGYTTNESVGKVLRNFYQLMEK